MMPPFINYLTKVRNMKTTLILLTAFSCLWAGNNAATTGSGNYDRQVAKAKYRRPEKIPFPAYNPPTAAKIELGRTLFFDPRLSGSSWISCASCHNPGFSWGDGLAKGIGQGMKTLSRRTPTILNTAFNETLFWDGRAASLEEQALGPIQSKGEMAMDLEQMMKVLKAIPGYAPLFAAAFPGKPLSQELVGNAIACYERTIVSGKAPFDRWIAGREDALNEEAKQGFDLFNTKANCAKCHSGWNFTDDGFHDTGVNDEDRGRAVVLNLPAMEHAFKTPTLRNAVERAPFLHNGSEPSLEDVIELYNKGGRTNRPSLSSEIKPLHLTEAEKRSLAAFLRSLSSADEQTKIPRLPR